MPEKSIERRTCLRFEIPGATISYKLDSLLTTGQGKYGEEFCPVLDISRGGLRFLCQKNFKLNQKIHMKISVPGERIPLTLKGRVRWSAANPGKSFNYQVGVQFSPYGEKKGQNYPGTLVKVIALEQKFSLPQDPDTPTTETVDFEVDG